MQQQIANYIHGKLLEILIVGVMTYIIFLSFGLNYPLLLSVAVGLSVLVPYIGAVLVTIPVALVAMFQFGISPTFWYLIVAFAVSQLLDGNLLVPYLFSEVVNLHSFSNHYFCADFWRIMGILGRILRDSIGYAC